MSRILIVEALPGLTGTESVLLTAIIVLLLIMGTFMDALANILILTPLLQPLVMAAGIDMTHFGIIVIVAVSIGFLTPPVGVNLFRRLRHFRDFHRTIERGGASLRGRRNRGAPRARLRSATFTVPALRSLWN
ncbi:MAG: TRAP transporter large permease subunit [Bilophila sp.]